VAGGVNASALANPGSRSDYYTQISGSAAQGRARPE
jgi:hypothetical protein